MIADHISGYCHVTPTITISCMIMSPGRIKHFQRLGLAPESPGKGRKISYKIENVYSWVICLEQAEFALDPSLIKTIMWTVGWVIPNVLMK